MATWSTTWCNVLSRPPICEAEASGRVIDLAYQAGCPLYIVHMTCEESLARVKAATTRNQKVHAETCVQYLLLDESLYFQDGFEGAKVVMSPPLRKEKDQEALWAAINQNLVQHVATDHCPFCTNQKEMGIDNFSKIPNGAPGVEHRVELMYSEGVEKGRISLNKFVEVTSTTAAKIFGLFPRKGTIAVGSDADIIVFDPAKKHTISADTHHMRVDYSAYEGWEVQGKCRHTILRGTVAIDDGMPCVDEGFGQYLKRPPFNPRY
jgi:dihydropyrimidinase